MAIADSSQSISFIKHNRRFDLDWLRVIAFSLLIFYHIGMFYVSWGWHVKSAYASPVAEPLMLIVNPWRLALLFFISGVAVRFATDKMSSWLNFVGSRLYRLGLPILLGVFVIVAPQSYFQLLQAGEAEPGYLAFYGNYLKLDQVYSMTTPTWNHLWYVVYLLVYIVLISPILPALRGFAEGWGGRWLAMIASGPMRLLLVFIIPFVFYELTLAPQYPTTHALVGDWANHAHRFTIFLLGYLVAKNMRFWEIVDRALPYAIVLVASLGIFGAVIDLNDALVQQSPLSRIPNIEMLMTISNVLYAWSFIVMLLGLAQRFLNRPSPALTYLTGAVFCYYIMHQTIIIVVGYWITEWRLGVWPEFLIVTLATIVGCAASYEIVKRVPFLRPWFGIKQSR